MSSIYNKFTEILPAEHVRANEPMAAHTTFAAGGSADFLLLPENAAELAGLAAACAEAGVKYLVIGNGSNILVRDGGFRGALITTKRMNGIKLDGKYHIVAACGVTLSKLANFALDNDLAGLEFASGIPGTVGGAVYMNAGAYGGEIKDSLESGSVLTADGSTHLYGNGDFKFDYRYSALQKSGEILTEAAFCLVGDSYVKIKDRMLDMNKRRAEKQPLDLPSAGSAFKRPPGSFAAKLIEDAGLAGLTIGGAKVSEKHCGFIVNAGGATAADITELASKVQEAVFERFGVALETEFRVIGEELGAIYRE